MYALPVSMLRALHGAICAPEVGKYARHTERCLYERHFPKQAQAQEQMLAASCTSVGLRPGFAEPCQESLCCFSACIECLGPGSLVLRHLLSRGASRDPSFVSSRLCIHRVSFHPVLIDFFGIYPPALGKCACGVKGVSLLEHVDLAVSPTVFNSTQATSHPSSSTFDFRGGREFHGGAKSFPLKSMGLSRGQSLPGSCP